MIYRRREEYWVLKKNHSEQEQQQDSKAAGENIDVIAADLYGFVNIDIGWLRLVFGGNFIVIFGCRGR